MNFSELFLYVQLTLHKLTQAAAVKAVGGFIFAVFASMHTQLLLCFALLVCIDLFTKLISLSRLRLLKQKRRKNPPTFFECVVGIRKARRAGYIKSSKMKHRFAGKIIVYILIALAGATFDYMMQALDKPTWATFLLIGYLAMTEIISIVENLQESGVKAAEDLHEILEKKIQDMKK